jgi:hypothetical protein
MGISDEGIKHLTTDIMHMLEKHTGLGDAQAWSNILSLVAKSEHDRLEWWVSNDNKDIYAWAEALKYDWSKKTEGRGVTMGLVGFTTHYEGKPIGDAQDLFKEYVTMGGEDLAPMSKECATDKNACEKLIKKIGKLRDDDAWKRAQWARLVSKGGSGYVHESMQICKKRGIDRPSALTLAALFDCSLNQGATGNEGCRAIAEKVARDIPEKEFLRDFLKRRLPIAGRNAYNDPPVNGKNRVTQFIKLLEADCMDLKDDGLVKKVTSWEMK